MLLSQQYIHPHFEELIDRKNEKKSKNLILFSFFFERERPDFVDPTQGSEKECMESTAPESHPQHRSRASTLHCQR
jgi:hypothetical protein